MSITKTTIIERIAKKSELSPLKAKGAVQELLEIMKSTLASGEDLMISDFGKFIVNKKAVRKGRNPATGESMMLKKRKIVTFKLSGKLRDRINNS